MTLKLLSFKCVTIKCDLRVINDWAESTIIFPKFSDLDGGFFITCPGAPPFSS